MSHKTLYLAGLFVVVLSGSGMAQDTSKMAYVLEPCSCTAADVNVIYGQLPPGSMFFDTASLPKTAKRLTAQDLSRSELSRMKRRAVRGHACELVIVDDYQTPSSLTNPNPEREIWLKDRIVFYMVQHVRPCPECPQPTTSTR